MLQPPLLLADVVVAPPDELLEELAAVVLAPPDDELPEPPSVAPPTHRPPVQVPEQQSDCVTQGYLPGVSALLHLQTLESQYWLQQSVFCAQAVPTWKQAPLVAVAEPLLLELPEAEALPLELLEAGVLELPLLELPPNVALLGPPELELETLPELLLLELPPSVVTFWFRQSASSCTQVPFTQESPKQPCGSQSS